MIDGDEEEKFQLIESCMRGERGATPMVSVVLDDVRQGSRRRDGGTINRRMSRGASPDA